MGFTPNLLTCLVLILPLTVVVLSESIAHATGTDRHQHGNRRKQSSVYSTPKSNDITDLGKATGLLNQKGLFDTEPEQQGQAKQSFLDTVDSDADDPDRVLDADPEAVDAEFDLENMINPVLDFSVRSDETETQWRRQVTGLIRGLSEQISGLQHTMINLKLQNHLLHRQLKRWHGKCGDKGSGRRDKTHVQPGRLFGMIEK